MAWRRNEVQQRRYEKLLAELHAEDRHRAAAFRAAYARNAGLNAQIEASRDPDNDRRRDEENENGVAEEDLLRRRGWDVQWTG